MSSQGVTVQLTTPSRLHFGLLGWGPNRPRQFGGLGVMVTDPGLEMSAEPSRDWSVEGPLSHRLSKSLPGLLEAMSRTGVVPEPRRLVVSKAPPEHVGLGTGTQVSLAAARILAESAGCVEPSLETLATWTGRGARSGIGLHGFALGGLIVDAGRSPRSSIPAMITRLEPPSDWSILLVIPSDQVGLNGPREHRAFIELPEPPEHLIDRLCGIVLLRLLPAVVEDDLECFGEALEDVQETVGRGFAPVQGDTFAHPAAREIIGAMKGEGLIGVGQSSWGPTLYGFSRVASEETANRIKSRFRLGPREVFWTKVSHSGASTIKTASG